MCMCVETCYAYNPHPGSVLTRTFSESRMPASEPHPQGVPRRARRRAVHRETLTPERWIEAATEVLVDHGIDNVRVDVLATELQVTRGSFYWHFRDREDLLRQVLQAWRDRATEQLTARLKQAGGDPRTQLREVLSLPFRGRAAMRAARIELALRAWARHDAMARQAVDEADAQRIDYIAALFESTGFARAEARQRAFVIYGYLLGESQLGVVGGASERATRQHFVERLLCQPLDAGAD